MKKAVWYNPEVSFIGAVGVSSARDVARLILYVDPGILDVLDIEDEDPTVEQVADELTDMGLRAMAVPTALLKQEVWDSAHVRNIDMDAKPGRGYVKVLGVSA